MTTYINRDTDTDIIDKHCLSTENCFSSFTLTPEEETNIFGFDFDENSDDFNSSKKSTFTTITIRTYIKRMVDILFKTATTLNPSSINLASLHKDTPLYEVPNIHKETYQLCKIVYSRDFRLITKDSIEEKKFNEMFKGICHDFFFYNNIKL